MHTWWFFSLSLLLQAPDFTDTISRSIFKGKAAEPYRHPGGLYHFVPIAGWKMYRTEQIAEGVEFRMEQQSGNTAFIQIKPTKVRPGANPRQLMLRAKEERLNRLPRVTFDAITDHVVAGGPAARIALYYWYQGNAQYPRYVEETFIVIDDDSYLLHFECFAPLVERLRSDLDHLYDSFQGRNSPAIPTESDPMQFDQIEKTPF